jgi:ring-1,2-phenylacetyl-CoA epoxidase subunit PaaE
MATKQIWTTAAIIKETKDTVTVVFDTGNDSFIYTPGQFIDVTLLINDLPVTRSYSLSSSREEDVNPSITVKRVNGGIMSNFINDNISSIDKWYIDGPYGNFTPVASTYTTRHIVLLAGGSGITPLYAIGRSMLSKSPDTKVTLIYSSRTTEDIIFKTSLEELAERYKGRLTSYHVLSQPKDDTALSGITVINGRLNKLIAGELIKRATDDPLNEVQYFICGPSGLMKMHREVLETLQVTAEHIYMEWFAPEAANEAVSLPQEPQEVLLHFYEQTNLLDVQAGQTILAAALEDRVPLPYSCKGGTCGKCIAKLISGEVKMINNYAIRRDDVDAGMILLCQSYPLNDDVTVEIA